MTPDLDAIRARAEAAISTGPWEARHEHDEYGDWLGVDIVHTYRNERVCWPNQILAATNLSPEDAEFIAHARTDIPALLAEVERLRAERDQAREECGHEKHMRKLASDQRDRFIAAKMRAEADRDRLAAVVDRVREALDRLVLPHQVTGEPTGRHAQAAADYIRAAIEGTDS